MTWLVEFLARRNLQGILEFITWGTDGLTSWIRCSKCDVRGPIITDGQVDFDWAQGHLHEP